MPREGCFEASLNTLEVPRTGQCHIPLDTVYRACLTRLDNNLCFSLRLVTIARENLNAW